MSRTKLALWGIISSQFYTIIGIFISLLSVPIIIKKLSPEIYGLSIIIFQITSYLGLFDFGLSAGIDKYLAGTRDDNIDNRETIKKIISTAIVVYGIIAIVIAVIGNIFSVFACRVFNAPISYNNDIQHIIATMSLLLGLQLMLRVISGIFFAHQRQLLSNTLSFIFNLSNTALTILFIYFGFGLWSFVYSQILVFIFNAILNIYYFNKYYSYFEFKLKYYDVELLKNMLSYGFSMFIITISVQIIFQTDRILVGTFVSLAAVTLYSVSTKIPELVTQFLWKITDNSFPAIVEISGKSSRTFSELHNKLMIITISLSSTAFWFLLVASYPFIKLWVGNKYYAGNYFLIITLYLYLIQHTFIHVTAMCINAAGIAKKIALMYCLEAILNILFSILLVKKYQIEGVIWGTILSGILTSGWYVPYVAINYMKSSLWSYMRTIIVPLIVTSMTGLFLYEISKVFFNNINNWFQLSIYSIIFVSIAILPAIFINKDLIKSLLTKLKQQPAV